MAVYTKKQLTEQADTIDVIRALTLLTSFRLIQTEKRLEETKDLLKKIEESIRRVYEIIPSDDKKVDVGIHDSSYLKRNLIQKPLYVFVASNKDLYGELIASIAKLYISDMKSANADGIVIGHIGKKLIEKVNLPNKILYYDIDDDRPNLAVLNQIVAEVEKYAKVVVYHGRNQSLLHQVAARSVVDEDFPVFGKPTKKYFFEPSPEDVMSFLRMQLAINSFHEKIFESQVARLTSRKWSWTKQQLTRSKMLEQLKSQYKTFRRKLVQKQQMATLTAKSQEEGLVVNVYQTKY